MAKPELGTKRMCPACATKYYDLNRTPIVCPNCGTVFEPVIQHRAAPARAVAPVAAAAEEEDVEDVAVLEGDADVVSLEDVEEEGAEPDVGPDVDADEEDVVIPDPDIDVDADIETADDPTFLEDEEEEGDDVAGLLDVEAGDEDEV